MSALELAAPPELLSVDEARREFVSSTLALLSGSSYSLVGLRHALAGEAPTEELSGVERALFFGHCRVIDAVQASGHGWIVAEQLDGIVSAVGLDGERLGDLGPLASVLSEEATGAS